MTMKKPITPAPWIRLSRVGFPFLLVALLALFPGCEKQPQTSLSSKETAKGNERYLLEAMLAISDGKKYPELKGNVATVYTHPLCMGSSSNAHYDGNAETYMNVGLGMGKAMVELLTGRK